MWAILEAFWKDCPTYLCQVVGHRISPRKGKEVLGVRVEGYSKEHIFKVYYGEMGGICQNGGEEGVGVRNHWMDGDDCSVDATEVLD